MSDSDALAPERVETSESGGGPAESDLPELFSSMRNRGEEAERESMRLSYRHGWVHLHELL
jgi:hypothetical protein